MINKREFKDSLRLRFNVLLSDLPSKCVCGEKYTEPYHAKRQGSWPRDTIAFATKVEPQLQPLHNERLSLRSAVPSSEAGDWT